MVWLLAIFLLVVFTMAVDFANKDLRSDVISTSRALLQLDGSGDIFVIMPSLSWEEARLTVKSAFSKARFPDRVNIGLVLGEEGVTQEEAEELVQGLASEFQGGKIRIKVEVPAFGSSLARAYAMHSLLRGERFVLSVHGHSSFYSDWDCALVASLDKAYKNGFHAVTQLPMSTFPGNEAESLSSGHATFSVLDQKLTDACGIPIFVPRLFNRRNPGVYRQPFVSCQCLFMETELAKPLFTKAIVPFAAPDEDCVIVSAAALSLGIKACNSVTGILTHIEADKRRRSFLDCLDPALVTLKEKVVDNIMGNRKNLFLDEFSSWDVLDSQLTSKYIHNEENRSRLRSGISSAQGSVYDEEIVDKYGSILLYRSLAEKLV